MTNREKFRDELVELHYVAFDKRDNKLKHCRKLSCRDCLFNVVDIDCKDNYKKWLNEEYNESKKQPTARDIEIMKACKEIFGFCYFAKDKNGTIFGYQGLPFKDEEMWCCFGKCDDLKISLSHLSWEDEEPYYFDEKNKNKELKGE